MKKILVVLLITMIPGILLAEENSGLVTNLEKGQKAPYDGVLLDNIAIAKILSSDQIDKEKCEIDCQYKLDLQEVKSDSIIEGLKISLEYERKEQVKTVQYYENQLQFLQDFKTEPPPDDDDLMWALIGGSVGVVATSITFGVIMGAIE